eukprot:1146608-Pelagomonas_calceolata.AAC.2
MCAHWKLRCQDARIVCAPTTQVAARHAALEDAARKLDSEASLVKRRLAQANGSLKMSSQKCARVERAMESAREAEQAAYEQRTQDSEAWGARDKSHGTAVQQQYLAQTLYHKQRCCLYVCCVCGLVAQEQGSYDVLACMSLRRQRQQHVQQRQRPHNSGSALCNPRANVAYGNAKCPPCSAGLRVRGQVRCAWAPLEQTLLRWDSAAIREKGQALCSQAGSPEDSGLELKEAAPVKELANAFLASIVLSCARRDEHEAAAASKATEEAAHKVDADIVAMRAQLKVCAGVWLCLQARAMESAIQRVEAWVLIGKCRLPLEGATMKAVRAIGFNVFYSWRAPCICSARLWSRGCILCFVEQILVSSSVLVCGTCTTAQAVEQSLHARDEELLRLTRRLDATRGTESEMEAKASAVQECRQLAGEQNGLGQE